ncbi:HU family DNA-binding protein [uncultured Chryseobacterium sp.]|uniref:HU family DNA-binding protein n=1 Tax=uncultured Chryseobacterium sp. TaxID=259322 RepID=UPI0025E6A259|nr:HU family DNA-binding protein [uncultured Chryseobacterium sp.]
MNKSELIDAIAKDAGISKVAAKAALESFVDNVMNTLKKKDGKVSLVGFGTFSVAERAARQGINPATKKPINIEAKTVAKFKAGADLAAAVATANAPAPAAGKKKK